MAWVGIRRHASTIAKAASRPRKRSLAKAYAAGMTVTSCAARMPRVTSAPLSMAWPRFAWSQARVKLPRSRDSGSSCKPSSTASSAGETDMRNIQTTGNTEIAANTVTATI